MFILCYELAYSVSGPHSNRSCVGSLFGQVYSDRQRDILDLVNVVSGVLGWTISLLRISIYKLVSDEDRKCYRCLGLI